MSQPRSLNESVEVTPSDGNQFVMPHIPDDLTPLSYSQVPSDASFHVPTPWLYPDHRVDSPTVDSRDPIVAENQPAVNPSATGIDTDCDMDDRPLSVMSKKSDTDSDGFTSADESFHMPHIPDDLTPRSYSQPPSDASFHVPPQWHDSYGNPNYPLTTASDSSISYESTVARPTLNPSISVGVSEDREMDDRPLSVISERSEQGSGRFVPDGTSVRVLRSPAESTGWTSDSSRDRESATRVYRTQECNDKETESGAASRNKRRRRELKK